MRRGITGAKNERRRKVKKKVYGCERKATRTWGGRKGKARFEE